MMVKCKHRVLLKGELNKKRQTRVWTCHWCKSNATLDEKMLARTARARNWSVEKVVQSMLKDKQI